MYLLLFIWLIPKSFSIEMVITWGKLTNDTVCDTTIKIVSSSLCFDYCMESDTCYIAQAYGTLCTLCGPDYPYPIQSLSEENANRTKIAFKATLTECPSSPNSTFSSENFTMEFSQGYWQLFKTTTTSTISSTTSKMQVCRDGWQKFTRVMGEWCIRVFRAVFSYQHASQNCCALGGVLSGIESAEERTFIINKGMAILYENGINEGSLWIGAHRSTACMYNNSTLQICVPMVNKAFTWTDGFTTGKSMMTWVPNQPDYAGKNEACVQMVLVNNAVSIEGAVSGQLNDIFCTATTSEYSLNYIRGFVCGQKAYYP